MRRDLWLMYGLGLIAGFELIAAGRTFRRAIALKRAARRAARSSVRILAGLSPHKPRNAG